MEEDELFELDVEELPDVDDPEPEAPVFPEPAVPEPEAPVPEDPVPLVPEPVVLEELEVLAVLELKLAPEADTVRRKRAGSGRLTDPPTSMLTRLKRLRARVLPSMVSRPTWAERS